MPLTCRRATHVRGSAVTGLDMTEQLGALIPDNSLALTRIPSTVATVSRILESLAALGGKTEVNRLV